MARYLYSELATAIVARDNCKKSNNLEWLDRWTEHIDNLVDMLPSGSGFDNGTKLNEDRSHTCKLVFETSFHHMSDSGMYDGWTEHTVTVTPTFGAGSMDIRVSGRNRNDIKEYIADSFYQALTTEVKGISE